MLRLTDYHAARFALLIAGATLLAPHRAGAAHPPSPPPCALDGVCLPKRETWGYYNTNWRPWPGDQVGIAPTPAIVEDLPEDQRGLGGFEEPAPQDEVRSGPNRPDVEEDQPTPGAEGIDGLDGFDGGEGLQPTPAVEEDAGLDPLGIRLPPTGGLLVQPAAARVQMAPVASPVPLPPASEVPSRLRVMPQPTTLPPVSSDVRQQTVAPPKNLESDDPPPALPTRLRRLTMLLRRGPSSLATAKRDDRVQAVNYDDPAPLPPARILERGPQR